MSVDGIIFDFNGVLLWDTPLHNAAWKSISARLRGTALTDIELVEKVHGRTNKIILEYVLNRPLADAEADDLGTQKELIYRQMCRDLNGAFTLSPGAEELLDLLSRQNFARAIATSSEKLNMAFYLEKFQLTRWFDPAHILYDDGTLPGKPAPDMYLRAAARLGLPPAACMVVEDSVSGIAAARAAGIGSIVALGPLAEHAALAALPGVRQVVASLAEIETLLNNLYPAVSPHQTNGDQR